MLHYSEQEQDFGELPAWVSWMIDLGKYHYKISTSGNKPRLLTVVSMPGRSAAAGLIALGGMLEAAHSEPPLSRASYFRYLAEKTRRYLDTGVAIQLVDEKGERWLPDYVDDQMNRVVVKSLKVEKSRKRKSLKFRSKDQFNGSVSGFIFEANCLNWRFENDSKPVGEVSDEILSLYRSLYGSEGELSDSIKFKSDGISIVARASSEATKFREELSSTSFLTKDRKVTLDSLLLLSSDSNTHTRVTLKSPETLDDLVDEPELASVEGTRCAGASLQHFRNSSLVIVVGRDEADDALESLSAALEEKSRYYKDYSAPELISPFGLIATRTMIKGEL